MSVDNTRYDFGRNWKSFSEQLTDEAIESAVHELERLVKDLDGQTVLDIGSGSGLHALSALRLNASSVNCLDYDRESVATSTEVLERYAGGKNWSVRQGDILGEEPAGHHYDLVYSWGVLHHTGDMWQAIRNASAFVKDGGRFLIALYIKTPLCPLWKAEKYVYSRYPLLRPFIRYPFAAAALAGHAVLGHSPKQVLQDYKSKRGMSFMHDIDDWLGGYPYESASHTEVVQFVEKLGFDLVDSHNTKTPSPYKWLFGTGCGEWLFAKRGKDSLT